jgi:protein-L-isoaspartate(D-aspartate) O-methyltransferase
MHPVALRRLAAFTLLALAAPAGAGGPEEELTERRRLMVREQIAGEGILDARVLDAMTQVPRHLFVPEVLRDRAYEPRPLPIGEGQTISQPYIVGYMTEVLRLAPGHRVLEVGTGSGYQAAVAARLAGEVYTIEIFESLATTARARLARLKVQNVTVRHGDGYYGWPEKAPFDAIIVTCAGGHVPPPLVKQLRPGGRLVMPVGGPFLTQTLVLVEKREDGSLAQRELLPVMFVRLLGH